MNPYIGAAMWIIAALVGFVIWWPIGAAFLAAITITAISQQITGYRLPPPQQPYQPRQPYQPLPPLYFDAEGKHIKQVTQTKQLAITDQSKKR